MELLQHLIDLALHLDRHLLELVNDYQGWAYGILFLIIFCETGLVVTPFLPGDSLLFACGALAASAAAHGDAYVLHVHLLLGLLFVAAVLGDATNYSIGYRTGDAILKRNWRFINRRHIERTQAFYEKHGGKTIVLARFIPIIRTFAPFVAGIGKMHYSRFFVYNVVGGLLWVSLFLYAGYFFGSIPIVKDNFTLVILAIIAISLIPPVVEYVRIRMAERAEASPDA